MMKSLLSFTALFVCAYSSFSQKRLPLNDAINIALKNNFNIQIAKGNVDINVINNSYGMAGGLPTVTGTAGDQESVSNINQRINNSGTVAEIVRNGATTNTISGNVTGSILLYNGMRVVATKKSLEALQRQSEQQLNAQVQTTIASVMVKYYDVVRQGVYLKALQRSIDLSKQQLDLIQVRKSVGLANNAELFQSQIDLNTRQQEYLAQELVLHQSTSDLLTLLNIRPDSNLVVQDTIVVDNNLQLDAVLNSLSQNPIVVSNDEQIKVNELIEKQTAAQRYPSLRFNTGLNFGRTASDAGQVLLNQSYGPFAGVSLSVPIYNGSIYKRQQQAATVTTKIARIQRESSLLGLQNDAVKTYQSYNINLSQLNKQRNTYDLSLQLMELSQERYRLAQATILEVREAQKSFEDAAYTLVNLSYAAKAAEIELKRLQNKLGL